MKTTLRDLIREQIKSSFVEEYQAKATEAQGLGLLIAHHFEWDGLAILETCYAALEDANFHTVNETIEGLIDGLKKEFVELDKQREASK
jgi:hypothetical protein